MALRARGAAQDGGVGACRRCRRPGALSVCRRGRVQIAVLGHYLRGKDSPPAPSAQAPERGKLPAVLLPKANQGAVLFFFSFETTDGYLGVLFLRDDAGIKFVPS